MVNERRQPHGLAIQLALLAILLMAAAFRFYNVNWDRDTYHIHPDERHTAMVAIDIQWPASLGEYLDTGRSPLNPANHDKVFFYGTFPLFLDKFLAIKLDMDTYDQIHLLGRVLSGLFDLGSVLLVFFLARRLFDWRAGLLAAFLLALAVLNIQGSHYFAADTFLTFFVTLTLWFIVDLAEGRGWLSFVGTGLSFGLTLASKVSVFLLVLIIVLGAWLGLRRRLRAGQEPHTAAVRVLGGLVLAGVLTLAVFRVTQPYAWAGPNYDGWDSIPEPWGERVRIFQKVPEPIRAVLMPNPQWIADMASAGQQQTGEADMPWGRQWTERTRWLYPLENMVVWGLGVPLSLAAWTGVALAVVWLARARRARRAGDDRQLLILIPLAWVLLLFTWQGAQFVKSIRYFLPIYPCLAMFGAAMVVATWDWAAARGRGWRVAAGVLATVVLIGTLAWALAFIQIYRTPLTRVAATRWIYNNVETAVTVHYRTAAGEPGQVQVAVPAIYVFADDGQVLSTLFTVPQDVVATEVALNDIAGANGPVWGRLEVQIVTDQAEAEPLAIGTLAAELGAEPSWQVVDLPDVPLAAGQEYYVNVTALEGAPLVIQGAVVANEHFDDPLPFNIDGRVSFAPSGSYRSLEVTYPGSTDIIDQLQLYDEDTPDKLEMLLDALDQADYIVMSSGRLHQSIPRLPMRYPMTTRYYELLFDEKLGFEKAVEFHSYPRLLGVEFNDDNAEEQFTVYDHPKVLIYHKTAAYDREQVERLLSDGIDWGGVAQGLNPRDVRRWKQTHQQQNDLLMSSAQREVQEQGGTWASIFARDSLANRWSTLTWYLLVLVLGLAALPLTTAIFGRLPDRGYILARPAGVLLLAWLSWMLTNLTSLHYTRGTILLALGLIMLGSAGSLLSPDHRRRFVDLWRTQWRLILATEGLFLVFFALFWLIRWGNPDLWHLYMGGEKPMDLAYLNAVIKSTEFPPYDPWFAGGYLNYYYFGQVMAGTLIKLIGIVPSVAYNLALPLWAAMTAMGAWSVTYNLVVAASRHRKSTASPAANAADASGEAMPSAGEPEPVAAQARPAAGQRTWLPQAFWFGLVAALFVAVLGNLGEIELILLKLGEGIMDTFQSTIPGLAFAVRSIIGMFEVIFGDRALPIPINEWYWNASRAIPTPPGESVITEFPFFTFLYADLHAHLLALPLTFLSLAAALAAVLRGAEERRPAGRGGSLFQRLASSLADSQLGLLVFWALVIGAMRCTNTWDVPPHLLLALGALGIAAIERRGGFRWRVVWDVGWPLALLFILSWSVLYRPFWAHYGSYYTSLEVWNGVRTPVWAYLVVHGLFLFAIATYLLARTFQRGEGWRPDPLVRRVRLSLRYRGRDGGERLSRAGRLAGVPGLPISRLMWLLPVLFIVAEILFLWPGRVDAQRAAEGVLAYKGLVVFGLGLPLAILGLWLVTRPDAPPAERLWAVVVLLGLAMSLGVEVIVLQGDIGRMNTVFKFYLQVWLMWGVAAAVALAWLVPRVRRWRGGGTVWKAVLGVLVFCAALYPPLATSAKIRDRFEAELGPGLDGWEYMNISRYHDPEGAEYDLRWDREAMDWLLDNVVGSPTILEGHVGEYRWGARYSINTGLPTVLGWNWHQRQQRVAAGDAQVWKRAEDVETMYSTTSAEAAMKLLHEYQVQYVIVGALEQVYYPALGLAKFERMAADGMLDRVFHTEGVTIYQVIQ